MYRSFGHVYSECGLGQAPTKSVARGIPLTSWRSYCEAPSLFPLSRWELGCGGDDSRSKQRLSLFYLFKFNFFIDFFGRVSHHASQFHSHPGPPISSPHLCSIPTKENKVSQQTNKNKNKQSKKVNQNQNNNKNPLLVFFSASLTLLTLSWWHRELLSNQLY